MQLVAQRHPVHIPHSLASGRVLISSFRTETMAWAGASLAGMVRQHLRRLYVAVIAVV
jgi:hypothetical protein